MKIRKMASLVIVISLGFSGFAHAQRLQTGSKVPTELRPIWRVMDIVAFNANPAFNYPTPSHTNKELAQKIWNKEIQSAPSTTFANPHSPLPSFVLISSHRENGVLYTFSILDAANAPGCIPAANGAGIVDMYSECPLRVTATNETTGKTVSQQFDDYCHLYVNNVDNPATKNNTQILIDSEKGVANFRIIQHGKQIPECNRTLRYKEAESS